MPSRWVPTGVMSATAVRQVWSRRRLRGSTEFGLFDASPIILNQAVGGAGREFANAVALVESGLGPAAMLAALKAIERDYGRRPGRRWGARVLDLDLIAWSGGRFATRRLTIPHPRLAARNFVLVPLLAVAPDWPIVGALTPRQLAARLGKRRRPS